MSDLRTPWKETQLSLVRETDQGPRFGFYFMLCIPVGTALTYMHVGSFGGFAFTGWLWILFLISGIFVIQVDMALSHKLQINFPYRPWLFWFGFVWLSLIWCERVGFRNLQDATQVSMPLLMGVAGSMFVRTEAQLKLLLRVFCWTLLLLCMHITGTHPTPRVLAITVSLIGCVFIAGSPPKFATSLLGWALCLLITGITGSRMATVALLLLPVLNPLYRGLILKGVMLAALAGVSAGLFYTSHFQQRFFYQGYGTLSQLFSGDIWGAGRFEAWPLIWEEAWRNPVLGAGVGSTFSFVPTVWPEINKPHNDYLRIFFELGFVGLALFLGVLVWQVYNMKTHIKRSDGVVRQAFVASLLGLYVFMILCLTDNVLIYNLWYTNPLFALMGAAYGLARRTGVLQKLVDQETDKRTDIAVSDQHDFALQQGSGR